MFEVERSLPIDFFLKEVKVLQIKILLNVNLYHFFGGIY